MTMTAEQRPTRRGRPRPMETIQRDEQVLNMLRDSEGGLTRNQVAEALDINTSRAYLALDRLRRDGKAITTTPETSQAAKDTRWVAVKGEV